MGGTCCRPKETPCSCACPTRPTSPIVVLRRPLDPRPRRADAARLPRRAGARRRDRRARHRGAGRCRRRDVALALCAAIPALASPRADAPARCAAADPKASSAADRRGLNGGRLDVIDELYARAGRGAALDRPVPRELPGRADGDRRADRRGREGRRTLPLLGHPPRPWRGTATGRRFERVDEVYIFRVHDGRITEAGASRTPLARAQLGSSPAERSVSTRTSQRRRAARGSPRCPSRRGRATRGRHRGWRRPRVVVDRGRPDHLVADGLDAVVEERAAGVLAASEIVDRARACRGRRGSQNTTRVGATLTTQQRSLEQRVVLGEALFRRVRGGAHVARDRRVGPGWEMQNMWSCSGA